MISLLFLLSILSYAYSIEFDKTDTIASHPDMMSLVNSIYERNVRRGLTNPSTLNAADRQNILDAHNKIRAATARGEYTGSGGPLPRAANMAELKYSLNLEEVATRWSVRCDFNHRSGSNGCAGAMQAASARPESPGYSNGDGCGENLYGSGTDPAWTSMFGDKDYGIKGGIEDSWCKGEAATWSFQNGMGSAGHYTQVIWDTSRYVGCGFSSCNSGWMKMMFTCNYYPAGNGFFGGRDGPYTRGTQCSACPDDIPQCTTGANAGLCTDNGAGTPATPSPVTTPVVTPSPVTTPVTPNPVTTPVTPSPVTTPVVTPNPVTTPVATPNPVTTPVTPSPVTTPVSENCLRIIGFTADMAVLNGNWEVTASGNWQKGALTLTNADGYFGYYNTRSQSYPDWDTYGWCYATSIHTCSSQMWQNRNGYTDTPIFGSSQCSGSDTEVTPAPVVSDGGGNSEGCVKIERLDINAEASTGRYKTLSEGTWEVMESSFNGYAVYSWSEGDFYMYTMEGQNWYTISQSIGANRGLKGWCGTEYGTHTDILDCDGLWEFGGRDTNCNFKSCSADSFNFAPCLDDADEYVCFYSNSTVLDSGMTFGVYEEEGCVDDKPVYKYVSESEDELWYIHYDSEIDMWKITVGTVDSDAVYVCGKSMLAECGKGTWIKINTGFGILSYSALEMAEIEICDNEVGMGDSDREEGGVSVVVVIVVIVVCVLLIVLIIGGVIFLKNRRIKGDVTFTHKSEIVKTGDKVPIKNTNDDTVGDNVNVGTDDEMVQP